MNWNLEQWTFFVSIVTLIVAVVIAVLQIRQQKQQSRQEKAWRDQDEARQAQERQERQPKLKLSFWDGRHSASLLQVQMLDRTDPLKSDDELVRDAEAEHEARLQTERNTPNADPSRHDEYLDDVQEYVREYRRWHEADRLSRQHWNIRAEFVVENAGRVPLSNVTAEIYMPPQAIAHAEESYRNNVFLNMTKPEPPPVPRVRRPPTVADLTRELSGIGATVPMRCEPPFREMEVLTFSPSAPATWIEDDVIHLRNREILAGDRWIADPILMIVLPTAGHTVSLNFELHTRELPAAQQGTLKIDVV